MGIGYGQVLALVSTLNPWLSASRIDGRLRNFQRSDFPTSKIRVGTGARADYGAASVWRVVLAFELTSFGLQPSAVVSAVESGWEASLRVLVEAWRDFVGDHKLVLLPGGHLKSGGGTPMGLRPIADEVALGWLRGDPDVTGALVIDRRSHRCPPARRAAGTWHGRYAG